MNDCTWDKEKVYDEEISPLMVQIIAICKREEMPIVASIQYRAGGDEGPGYCTTVILDGKGGAKWAHAGDKIRKLAHAHQPERPVCLTETIVTQPDGTRHITIRQVR